MNPAELRLRSPFGIAKRFAFAALLTAPWQVALPAPDSPQQQVFAAERAFAKSMANRDVSAFASHVSDEAIFFSRTSVLRGKQEVVAAWSRFFKGKTAPFSWEPDRVEVLQSGTLALSTGLVRDPNGKVISRFNSVWRRETPGVWRVVFDKGSPAEPNDKHQGWHLAPDAAHSRDTTGSPHPREAPCLRSSPTSGKIAPGNPRLGERRPDQAAELGGARGASHGFIQKCSDDARRAARIKRRSYGPL